MALSSYATVQCVMYPSDTLLLPLTEPETKMLYEALETYHMELRREHADSDRVVTYVIVFDKVVKLLEQF